MAIGAAVIGGLGVISGIMGGREADKAAQRNADRIRAETAEAVRRMGETQKETLALTRAGAAASGMRTMTDAGTTGEDATPTSSELYIDKMEKEFKKQLNWAKTSGASAAAIEEQRGKAARWQGYASALGSLSGVFGGLYNAGYMRGGPSNWLNRVNPQGSYYG